MDDLLRSISWNAEKQFRRHGGLPLILWLTEDSKGRRELWDRWCRVPASVASDAEVLAALAEEMIEDFAKAGIVRFAVAYLGRRVTTVRPLDPNAPVKPTTTKRQGVVIELHGLDQHLRVFREIIRLPGREPTLAAAEAIDEPYTASPYANVLDVQACNAAMDQLLGEPE